MNQQVAPDGVRSVTFNDKNAVLGVMFNGRLRKVTVTLERGDQAANEGAAIRSAYYGRVRGHHS